MADVSIGLTQGPGGFYRTDDRSGPYAIGPDGSATLLNNVVTSLRSALPLGTDRSGSLTTGGAAQALAPANPGRLALVGQNTSANDLWINEAGATATAGGSSYRIASGGFFQITTSHAISVFGATAGQTWAATET